VTPTGKCCQRQLAATLTTHTVAHVLTDQHADQRQLRLLEDQRLTRRLTLLPAQTMPATRAVLGPALQTLVHPLRGNQFTLATPMPGLAAPLTPRTLAAFTLGCRRRIRRRRTRAVLRVLPQPTLQLLDPCPQTQRSPHATPRSEPRAQPPVPTPPHNITTPPPKKHPHKPREHVRQNLVHRRPAL
jgi:hypothetical protein